MNYVPRSHSTHRDPFGALAAEQSAPRREYPFITPMRLLDILWKTEQKHHGLTASEKATLSTLITYVNLDGVAATKFYKAWPTIDLLKEQTGLSRRTLEDNRKTLERKEWVRVDPGKRKGQANHYFINGQKIAEAYNLSHVGDEVVVRGYDVFKTIKPAPPRFARNVKGLKQGTRRPGQAGTQGEADSQPESLSVDPA